MGLVIAASLLACKIAVDMFQAGHNSSLYLNLYLSFYDSLEWRTSLMLGVAAIRCYIVLLSFYVKQILIDTI